MCFVLCVQQTATNKRLGCQKAKRRRHDHPLIAAIVSVMHIHAYTIYNNRHHRHINRNDTQKVGYMGVPYERGVEMTQHFQSVTVRNAVSGWWSGGGGWSNIEGGGRER